jgi:hypothetical protein
MLGARRVSPVVGMLSARPWLLCAPPARTGRPTSARSPPPHHSAVTLPGHRAPLARLAEQENPSYNRWSLDAAVCA